MFSLPHPTQLVKLFNNPPFIFLLKRAIHINKRRKDPFLGSFLRVIVKLFHIIFNISFFSRAMIRFSKREM